MSTKKVLAVILSLAMVFAMAACATETKPAETPAAEAPAAEAPATEAPATEEPAAPAEDMYIAVISKGFQHQFWQVVKQGADDAAKEYGVTVTFDGPPSESDIGIQVDMLKAAMAKEPAAIALAALSTDSVMEELNTAKNNGIPVIGFDSGVPNAPEGSIYATASTDNKAAAAIAAEHLFGNADFTAKLAAATPEAPIVVCVLSQDATSESVVNRTLGFTEKLEELVGADNVAIAGHDKYAKANDKAKLLIQVSVPATTANTDLKAAAEALLSMDNVAAIYGSNESAAGGILAASNDGNDFNKETGKFKDILAIGFDAGKVQRTAVENGWFYGSITQDPYSIGYKAVELAVKAAKGEIQATNEIVDTGAKWYDSTNVNEPGITELVYE